MAFSLRLDDSIQACLRERAASEGRSVNDLILAAITAYQGGGPTRQAATPPWTGPMVVRVMPSASARRGTLPWDIIDPERKLAAKTWACGLAATWPTWAFDAYRMGRRSDNRITGADMVVTLLMRSRLASVEMDALMAKASEIEAALGDIPDQPLASADLDALEPELLRLFKACRSGHVAIAKVTKLLTLLRPQLLPILDREVIGSLFGTRWSGRADPDDFAEDAFYALSEFKRVLVYKEGDIDNLAVCNHVAAATTAGMRARGLPEPVEVGITAVRVLESLLWFDWWGGAPGFGYHHDLQADAVVLDPSGRSGPVPVFAAPAAARSIDHSAPSAATGRSAISPADADEPNGSPACDEESEPDDYDESVPLPLGWWRLLAAELRRLQASPGYFATASQGVPNDILQVDETAGFVRMLSRRSLTGRSRDITRDMIEWPDNAHGVVRRDLRALVVRLCRRRT